MLQMPSDRHHRRTKTYETKNNRNKSKQKLSLCSQAVRKTRTAATKPTAHHNQSEKQGFLCSTCLRVTAVPRSDFQYQSVGHIHALSTISLSISLSHTFMLTSTWTHTLQKETHSHTVISPVKKNKNKTKTRNLWLVWRRTAKKTIM